MLPAAQRIQVQTPATPVETAEAVPLRGGFEITLTFQLRDSGSKQQGLIDSTWR